MDRSTALFLASNIWIVGGLATDRIGITLGGVVLLLFAFYYAPSRRIAGPCDYCGRCATMTWQISQGRWWQADRQRRRRQACDIHGHRMREDLSRAEDSP